MPKLESFNPLTVLQFIIAIFKPMTHLQRTELVYETTKAADLDKAFLYDHNETFMTLQPLPLCLIGDEVRLKQILINLVKNALKFCRGGVIRVIMAFDEVKEVLKVHVVDTGKGILAEDIDRLFKQFGKLHRTAEMNNEGIGLGLMICQNLVI